MSTPNFEEKKSITELTNDQIELIVGKLHKAMETIESATPSLQCLKFDTDWKEFKKIALDLEQNSEAYTFQEITNFYNQIKIFLANYLATQEDPNEQSQETIRKNLQSNFTEFIGIQIIEEEKIIEKKGIEAMTNRIIMGEAEVEDIADDYVRKIREQIYEIFYQMENETLPNPWFIAPTDDELFEILLTPTQELRNLTTSYKEIIKRVITKREDIEFQDGDTTNNVYDAEDDAKDDATEDDIRNRAHERNNESTILNLPLPKECHKLSGVEKLWYAIKEKPLPPASTGQKIREQLSRSVAKKST